MDEKQRRDFRWYVLGSRKVGHEPTLGRDEFLAHYDRYQRLSQAIYRYELRRRRLAGRRRGTAYQDDVFLERLLRTVREEQQMLRPLAAAVDVGRSLENGDMGDGGAGVGAYRYPYLPVLTGTGAKLPPHLDPEPWARDP